MIKKMLIFIGSIFASLIIAIALYLFVGTVKPAENIGWGVVFSQKHSQLLGLDWRANYMALLDDLKVKKIKIASYWDLIENNEGEYDFTDLDWQINEASSRGVEVLLAIGMKSPRWPECHIPGWAKSLEKTQQQDRIVKFLTAIVLRYNDANAIVGWQVENEPFFVFGECPWVDEDFLKQEVSLVKSLDNKRRPIILAESGEGMFWLKVAGIGDRVGITMYKKVWFSQLGSYVTYPFPPIFYHRKALLVEKFFHKDVICVELQAEPWGPKLIYDSPLSEQQKTMDLERFKYNVDFAKRTGLKEFYLWGAEWWYWMKEKNNDSAIWEESKVLFKF
jgi:hypothetical protein